MESEPAQKAISAALSGNWKEAVSLNKEILTENPKDIDALNRLARAYAELGYIKKAKALAGKILKLDHFNTIAAKALKKWRGLSEGSSAASSKTSAEAFLEEPGKTKMVPLLYLGDPRILAKLDAGDEVQLKLHGHRVSVITSEGKYIGRLTDDLSARLRKLISFGNEYQVLIKSTQPDEVKIFIREVRRSPQLKSASFPTEKIEYISFTPPELVHRDKEEISQVEEE